MLNGSVQEEEELADQSSVTSSRGEVELLYPQVQLLDLTYYEEEDNDEVSYDINRPNTPLRYSDRTPPSPCYTDFMEHHEPTPSPQEVPETPQTPPRERKVREQITWTPEINAPDEGTERETKISENS